jgi:outer membrane protein OmpA-like peptidoglycan-associated protein
MNMFSKISIIAALELLTIVAVCAQTRDGRVRNRNQLRQVETEDVYEDDGYSDQPAEERTAVRTTWIANEPGSNWFLNLYGGAAYLGSENFREVAFADNLAFSGGFVLGKWFSPVWGLGAHFSASRPKSIASKGGIWYIGQNYLDPNGNYSPIDYVKGSDYPAFIEERFLNDATPYVTTSGKQAYLYKFTYATLGLDFLVNLRNLTSVYDPDAFFNPVIYGGLGYYHTFAEGQRTAVNGILERFGLQFNFKVSPVLGLNLTFEDLMIPEVFDRQVGGNLTQDHVLSANVGLTIHFGENNFVKAGIVNHSPVFQRPDPQPLPTVRSEIEREDINCQLNNLREKKNRRRYNPYGNESAGSAYINESLVKDLRRAAKTEIIRNYDYSPYELSPVFFSINSYKIRDDQILSIAKAAVYLDTHPDVTLVLAAFSDRETGNQQGNLALSEKRVKAVADVLIKQFAIERERLVLSYYGDLLQPYSVNEKNRVVLFLK